MIVINKPKFGRLSDDKKEERISSAPSSTKNNISTLGNKPDPIALGLAANSGYTEAKQRAAQATNRQIASDLLQRGQEGLRNTFSGYKDDAETQRERALLSKMGLGENWGDSKTAFGSAIESAAANTTASLLNAAGTLLVDDRRHGLAVDSGDVEATETDVWHNRWGQGLQSNADRVQQISEEAYARGSENLNAAEQVLFDLGIAGAQMLGDMAAGPASPYLLAARGFGGGAMQARQAGGGIGQQVMYGGLSAGLELLTEKMFDGVAKAYGKGAADDVIQKVAEKLAKTPQGQSVIRAIANAGGEGLEEMISAIVDPALQTIYNDKTINGRQYGEKGAYDDVKIADILYDGLIGTLLGSIGGGIDIYQTAKQNPVKQMVETLKQAGASDEDAEKLAPMMTSLLNGEEISGNQAAAIATNEAAIKELQAQTGETINTDAPLGEVKKAVRELAARQGAQTSESVTEDTPKAETAQTASESETGNIITRMGKTMGKAGETVMNGMYAEGQDATQYAESMVRAYNAGLNGRDISEAKILRDENGAAVGVTDMQINEAFKAGQTDAQTALAKEKAAANYAKVAGTDSGLVYDDYVSKTLSKTTAERVNSVAKALGVRVRFVDSVAGGEADAQYSGSEILIEKENPNPTLFLLGHEWTHRMQDLAPEAYRDFRNALAADARFEAAVEDRIRLYEKRGRSISYDAAADEVAADHAGALLQDGKMLDEFISKHKENRTVLEKMLDAIRDLIRKLTGAEKRMAQTAEEKLMTALNEAAKRSNELSKKAQKNTAEDSDAKYALKSKAQPGKLDPRTVTRNDVFMLLTQVENGAIYGNTYIPIRVGTPEKLIYWAKARRGDIIENRPIAISADKAYNAMNREGETGTGRENALSVDEMVSMVEAMSDPQYIVYQGANDRYVEVVQFSAKKGDKAFAVIEIGNNKDSVYMNGYEGGLYNILVTTYPPKSGKLNELLSNSDNQVIYDKKKDASQRTSSSTVPSVLNDASFFNDNVTLNEEKSKGNFSLKGTTALLEEYGAIEPGEKPVRDVQVPRKTEKNKNVSKTVRTIMEAEATPDEMLPNIEELVVKGDFSYETYGDKEAISNAESKIKHTGWASALTEWTKSVENGEVSKDNTAMGWALYNNAANSGDTATALTILDNMVRHQRSAAQALQATRILKKLSPETQLYQVAQSVAKMQEDLNKKYGDAKSPKLKVDEELAKRFMTARDQDARDAVMKEIYRDIGKQLPSTFMDKWNAWRYLAMLGNARTHVRNIVGNAGFAPIVATKNLTATAIESVVHRLSGGKLERSKSILTARDKDLLKAAWDDYAKVSESSMDGKYNDAANANKYIEEGRRVFKLVPLEAARRGNTKALSAEDTWFAQPYYAAAMASYCKAHGITADQIASGGKIVDAVREYADKEAKKATYQDANAFSKAVSGWGRGRNAKSDFVQKGVNLVLEGVLPFRKTPANILVRGIEYSPIGLMNGIKQALVDVKNGTKTGAEAIDTISAGLTGTGLMALGILLAAEGLIRGHGDDEEKKNEFMELMGHQAYSLELPNGTSVTLDWLAPECLPFFVGVNLWEQTGKEADKVTLSSILDSVSTVTEPLLEMSCLQSLNDVFDSVGYAASEGLDGLPSALASASTSWLLSALPTLLGQTERSGEDVRMTTYTEKNAFLTKDMQYTLGKASARIPIWDYQQIPYIDAWGRKESSGSVGERTFNNFINPAYTSTVDESAMEKELLRLYEETGEAKVFPDRAGKYFNVDKVRIDLTAEQYVKYATAKGQTAQKLMTALTKSSAYKAMSNADKVDAVSMVYEYANAVAKTKVSGYKLDGWAKKAYDVNKKTGVKIEQYIALYLAEGDIKSLKDRDGKTIDNSAGLQIMEEVYKVKGLTDEQRQALFEAFGVGKKVRHYNKALVAEKLAQMRKQ